MIERLLAAEQALAEGRLDTAERLFRQVADADGRNAIAVVGLGRVAQLRGERETAATLADRALAIDPEDAAGLRLRDATTTAPIETTTSVAPPAPHAASFVARLSAWLRGMLRRDRRGRR